MDAHAHVRPGILVAKTKFSYYPCKCVTVGRPLRHLCVLRYEPPRDVKVVGASECGVSGGGGSAGGQTVRGSPGVVGGQEGRQLGVVRGWWERGCTESLGEGGEAGVWRVGGSPKEGGWVMGEGTAALASGAPPGPTLVM